MPSASHVAICELDLALTYALNKPRLALDCARVALGAAIRAHRPDLAYRANTLIAIVGAA